MERTNTPFLSVILTKKDTKDYPTYELPVGYTFCEYEVGMELDWVKLQVSYEAFDSFASAISYFQTAIKPKIDLLKDQFIFVKNGSGEVVATCSLIDGLHFGVTVKQIQFLAVNPFHRGRGIGKAMVSKLLEVYNLHMFDTGIYAMSSTWACDEVNMMFMFGFVAYEGPKPPKMVNITTQQFETNRKNAWMLIRQMIGVRSHERKILDEAL